MSVSIDSIDTVEGVRVLSVQIVLKNQEAQIQSYSLCTPKN